MLAQKRKGEPEIGSSLPAFGNDLGLVYMNARYYNPSIRRFIFANILVPDPANPQAFNRYSYIDESGLESQEREGAYSSVIGPAFGIVLTVNSGYSYYLPRTEKIGELMPWVSESVRRFFGW